MKTTKEQNETAAAFLSAFNAFQASTADTRKAADKALCKALEGYRKAHGLSSALGLLDLINHFNQTHATA
jgi:hypothetical protein